MTNSFIPPLYGYVSVTPDTQYRSWITHICNVLEIQDFIQNRDIHCTIVYDPRNIITYDTLKFNRQFNRKYSAKINGVQILGDSLVFTLDSPDLMKRNKELLNLGFKNYNHSYIPHISIKTNPTKSDLMKFHEPDTVKAIKLSRNIVLSMENWEYCR